MVVRKLVFIAVLALLLCGCGGAKKKSDEFFRKGLELEKVGKTAEALQLYQKATETYGKNVKAQEHIQDILIAQGKKDDVLKKYKNLMGENPRDGHYYYLYGRLLGWDKGKEYFNKCISVSRKSPWGYYGLGLSLQAEKQFEDSLENLQKAVDIDPNMVDAHIQLGRTYAMLGKLKEGESEFRKAVEIDPASADGYFYLGNMCLINGSIGEAQMDYEKVLTLDPSSKKALAGMAKIHLLKGDGKEAMRVFQKIQKLNPDDSVVQVGLARSLYLQDKKNDAVKLLKKALWSGSTNEIHYLLALAYMDQGRWSDALEEFSKLERNIKNFPGIHKAKALIHLANGRESQAEEELAKEVKINPRDPEVCYIKGQILFRRFQILKAEEEFKSALAIDSRYYPSYLGLGQVEEYFKEYARALNVYDESLAVFPNDVEILYRMGDCYSWRGAPGDEKRAYECWKKAFELGMDDWNRVSNDMAIQGLKDMPEVAELLKKYQPKPGAISKYKHSQLMSTTDIISGVVNRAYRKQ
ncbi:MAG: tetratricopeptide repeat protein [Vulcanimicrobiota bacterium]